MADEFHFSMPFPFQQPTEEEIAEHRRQQEINEMRSNEFQHNLERLMEELDEDQLGTLKIMLGIVVSNTSFPMAAAWQGMIAHAMKIRFNICAAHGVNHDKEFFEQQETSVPPEHLRRLDAAMSEATGVEIIDGHIPPADFASDEPIPEVEEQIEFGMLDISDEQRSIMDLYHLDDEYEEGTNKFLGFRCTGIKGSNGPCGLRYPSLADRMIKEPENCHGCFVRNAHG